MYEPGKTGDVAAAIDAATGDGPTTTRGRELGTRLLTPYLVLVSFLPLAFLLGRDDRDFTWERTDKADALRAAAGVLAAAPVS